MIYIIYIAVYIWLLLYIEISISTIHSLAKIRYSITKKWCNFLWKVRLNIQYNFLQGIYSSSSHLPHPVTRLFKSSSIMIIDYNHLKWSCVSSTRYRIAWLPLSCWVESRCCHRSELILLIHTSLSSGEKYIYIICICIHIHNIVWTC